MPIDKCLLHKSTYEKFTSVTQFSGQWSAKFLQIEEFGDILTMVAETISSVGVDENGTTIADCPWQASLYLLLKAFLLADESFPGRQELMDNLGLNDIGVTLTAYRGQRDPSWGFIPSIEHTYLSEDEKAVHELATKLFCSILNEGYSRTDEKLLESDSFLSIAQHYGLKTTLLDFTTDPAISVFFANQGASDGDICAVYSLPIAKLLSKIRILLPPPYAKRLYLQRGFFLEVVDGNANQIKDLCRLTLFRASSNFRVSRWSPGATDFTLDLLPGDELIEEIKERVLKAAAELFTRGDDSFSLKSKELSKELRIVERFPPLTNSFNSWVVAAEEILEQLTIQRIHPDIRIAPDILNKIAMDNLHFMKALAKRLHERSKQFEKEGEHLAAQLELALAEKIAGAVCRALYFRGEIDLSDQDLLAARRGEFSEAEIASKAFQIWQSTGSTHGNDLGDWFQAELELCRLRY